jgi:hypothetical protein
MSHWFLVGRDLMWVAIVFSPILLAMLSVWSSVNCPNDFAQFHYMFFAVTIHVILCVSLYGGFIK